MFMCFQRITNACAAFLPNLRERQLEFGSEISIYFFDSMPHVLSSGRSSLRLTAKRRPPRELQGNFEQD